MRSARRRRSRRSCCSLGIAPPDATVSVNLINGGSAANVVPDECRLDVGLPPDAQRRWRRCCARREHFWQPRCRPRLRSRPSSHHGRAARCDGERLRPRRRAGAGRRIADGRAVVRQRGRAVSGRRHPRPSCAVPDRSIRRIRWTSGSRGRSWRRPTCSCSKSESGLRTPRRPSRSPRTSPVRCARSRASRRVGIEADLA